MTAPVRTVTRAQLAAALLQTAGRAAYLVGKVRDSDPRGFEAAAMAVYEQQAAAIFAAIESEVRQPYDVALLDYVYSQKCSCNEEEACPDRPFRDKARSLLSDTEASR